MSEQRISVRRRAVAAPEATQPHPLKVALGLLVVLLAVCVAGGYLLRWR